VLRAVALVAAGLILVGTSSGATPKRALIYARLQLPSLGTLGVDDAKSCGPSCTTTEPHLFAVRGARPAREMTPRHMLFQLEDLEFATPERGWMVANDCSAGKAFVYRTADGGRSWKRARVGATNCAAGSRLDLSFADARHGWILDDVRNAPFAQLAQTVDGGRTWVERGRAPVTGSIVFRNEREGWLGRTDLFLQQQLYATRDGGRTWARRSLRRPHGWSGARLFPDVPTFFGRRGVLPATLARSGRVAVAFYVTRDAGRTWSVASVRTAPRPASSSSPFVLYVPTSIVGPGIWWTVAAGRGPAVALTTDSGTSWRVRVATGVPPLRAAGLSAVDARHAWLTTFAGGGVAAYGTGDAGRSWQRLGLPSR
jgi:photosystem II stability/assembly factor-like uncharacterized protein